MPPRLSVDQVEALRRLRAWAVGQEPAGYTTKSKCFVLDVWRLIGAVDAIDGGTTRIQPLPLSNP